MLICRRKKNLLLLLLDCWWRSNNQISKIHSLQRLYAKFVFYSLFNTDNANWKSDLRKKKTTKNQKHSQTAEFRAAALKIIYKLCKSNNIIYLICVSQVSKYFQFVLIHSDYNGTIQYNVAVWNNLPNRNSIDAVTFCHRS